METVQTLASGISTVKEPRHDESVIVEIATRYIRQRSPTVDVQFSNASYITDDHHYAPLRKCWLAYFNIALPGVLASFEWHYRAD